VSFLLLAEYLTDIRSELTKIIAELGDIKTKSLPIAEKHHEAIRGPNNTTLNVVLGEDRNVAIRFGPGDVVEIRGPSNELGRVQKEIEAIVTRAESEGIETSYVSGGSRFHADLSEFVLTGNHF
jgi:hypothetical protein